MNERRVRIDRRRFDAGPPRGFDDRRGHEEHHSADIEIPDADMTTFTIRRQQYLITTEYLTQEQFYA